MGARAGAPGPGSLAGLLHPGDHVQEQTDSFSDGPDALAFPSSGGTNEHLSRVNESIQVLNIEMAVNT